MHSWGSRTPLGPLAPGFALNAILYLFKSLCVFLYLKKMSLLSLDWFGKISLDCILLQAHASAFVKQCDQIGLFLKSLDDEFSFKSRTNLLRLFELKWNV